MDVDDFQPNFPNSADAQRMKILTEKFSELADFISGLPIGPEKHDYALQKLLEAKMVSIHAVTHP